MKPLYALTLCSMFASFSAVPAVAAEPQIAWSRNLYESFLKTNESGKPLIVYFTQTNCGYCRQLERAVLNEPEMAGVADRAEFVWADSADEDDKGNYGQLRRDLKIDKVPAVVVLQTSPEGIREQGRIIGYFPLEAFVSNLNHLLPPAPAPAPAPVPAPALDAAPVFFAEPTI